MASFSLPATSSWLEVVGGVVAAIALLLAAGAVIKRLVLAIIGLIDRFR